MDPVINSVPRNPNDPRFPVLSAQPSSQEVRQNFNFSDLMQWGALTAISFPVGYISGRVLFESIAPNLTILVFLRKPS